MRILILGLAAFLITAAPVVAQSQPELCAHFSDNINAIVNKTPPQPNQDFVLSLLDIGQGTRCFAEYAAERALLMDFVRRFEGSRGDKQSGGSGGAAATSVVSQGPVAKVLSVAAEYGAVTQSVSGQVITIRGNLAGLPTALVQQNLVPYCVPQDRFNRFCIGNSTLGILRRFSFAAAFNAASQEVVGTTGGAATPAGQPVVFEAARNQLASASIRVELGRLRDGTSEAFQKKWASEVGKTMSAAAAELSKKAGDFVTPMLTTAPYKAWRTRHAQAVRDAGQDRERIVRALNAALVDLQPLMRQAVPDLEEKSLAALGAYSSFMLKQDQLIEEIGGKVVAAVEYGNNRPPSQPHTSNVRFIFDVPFKKNNKLVANFAATWYDASQTNTDGSLTKYRDAQAAVQYERGLGDLAIIGPANLSFAFYYQYQHAPALLKADPLKPVPGVTFVDLPDNAKTVFAEKGDIFLGQIKLSLTPKESSVKIPLAVTIANRSELIKTPKLDWKAQIGVTYDFDSLFARGK